MYCISTTLQNGSLGVAVVRGKCGFSPLIVGSLVNKMRHVQFGLIDLMQSRLKFSIKYPQIEGNPQVDL